MPKLNDRPPKLCHRVSNDTGYIYIEGRQVYMGKWGPAAQANYRKFVSDWSAGTANRVKVTHPIVSLPDLFAPYLLYIDSILTYSAADKQRISFVVRIISELYPDMAADKFGPLQLEAVRDRIQKMGFERNGERCEYSRQYLNKLVNAIRGIFRWGVSKTLVDKDVHQLLMYVEPLRYNRCSAPESTPRNNAEDKDIEATLPYMLSVYRDMILILRLTGMRPSELCRMRKKDIDRSRSDGIWLYTPSDHKTKGRGKERIIPLGDKSQAILSGWITKKQEDEYIFSPRDVREEQWAQQRQSRKTRITPSQAKRNEKRSKTKYDGLNAMINVQSIARNVKKAIKKAVKDGVIIEPWTPYCIRHQLITVISELEGPVASQRIAGHSSLNTTDIYNHAALHEAIELTKKYG